MRKFRLVDCDPRWGTGYGDDVTRYITFACPEGHEDCRHTIPFTPALDGSVQASPQQNGVQWSRIGDTFETLTLAPSIRRIPRYADRQAALDAGCLPEHITESMLCALHINVMGGVIDFCVDSR